MSTGSWFKAHRKQVITHTSIVVIFILFVIFVSEPLFDRFEAIQGESSLCDLTLPAEKGNITYCFDEFVTDGRTTVEIRGWAFIWGQDSLDNKKYVVLKSVDRTYVFTSETMIKESLTEHFKELNVNLDYSEFRALIPARKIDNGEYTVGFYITKGDIEALKYTSRTIRKTGEILEIK